MRTISIILPNACWAIVYRIHTNTPRQQRLMYDLLILTAVLWLTGWLLSNENWQNSKLKLKSRVVTTCISCCRCHVTATMEIDREHTVLVFALLATPIPQIHKHTHTERRDRISSMAHSRQAFRPANICSTFSLTESTVLIEFSCHNLYYHLTRYICTLYTLQSIQLRNQHSLIYLW